MIEIGDGSVEIVAFGHRVFKATLERRQFTESGGVVTKALSHLDVIILEGFQEPLVTRLLIHGLLVIRIQISLNDLIQGDGVFLLG